METYDKDIPRTLRRRPLLQAYSPSEAFNALGGIQSTLQEMIGDNTRMRIALTNANKRIEQLEAALLEINRERQQQDGGQTFS